MTAPMPSAGDRAIRDEVKPLPTFTRKDTSCENCKSDLCGTGVPWGSCAGCDNAVCGECASRVTDDERPVFTCCACDRATAGIARGYYFRSIDAENLGAMSTDWAIRIWVSDEKWTLGWVAVGITSKHHGIGYKAFSPHRPDDNHVENAFSRAAEECVTWERGFQSGRTAGLLEASKSLKVA